MAPKSSISIKIFAAARRSSTSIIFLYDTIAQQPEFQHQHIYHEQAQLQGKDKSGGYVSIDFLEEAEEQAYALDLCAHVEALIHQVRDRGYAWRDIAILSRTNSVGSSIASHLLGQGIPVVSSESLLIAQSHTVRAIISFLYYLTDKDNNVKAHGDTLLLRP